ncbi:MAG: hypothetical protein Q4B92_03940 [Ruminococcus sp.]|nr:hypothetical protein [Ruminococcus sp.]
MFSNVGEKIKGWAILVFSLTAVAAIAGIITTIALLSDLWWWDGSGFVIFLIVLAEVAVGVAIALFMCQLVYGFGVIVSNHERQERDYIKEYTKRPTESNNIYNGSLFKKMDENRAPKGQVATGEWKCPKCGKVNQNYVGTCGCGQIKPK